MKVTLSEGEPAGGAVVRVVQVKVPGTDAVPPVSVEEAKVCPKLMGLAVGHTETVGVALFTVSVTLAVADV